MHILTFACLQHSRRGNSMSQYPPQQNFGQPPSQPLPPQTGYGYPQWQQPPSRPLPPQQLNQWQQPQSYYPPPPQDYQKSQPLQQYPQQPSPMPPVQPPKKSRKKLWVIIGIVVGI